MIIIKGDHVKDAKAKYSQNNERAHRLHLASKNFFLSEDFELKEYVVEKEKEKIKRQENSIWRKYCHR